MATWVYFVFYIYYYKYIISYNETEIDKKLRKRVNILSYYVKIDKYHGYTTLYHGINTAYLSLACAKNGFKTIKKARNYMKRLKKKSDEYDEITIVSKEE